MIEKILRKSPNTFCHGEVTAINIVDRKAQVQIGENNVWIKTEFDLSIGDTVILARGADSKIIIQSARKSLPADEILLLI